MAEVCEAAVADVMLSDGLQHDDRIGGQFLDARLGGDRVSKDLRALMARLASSAPTRRWSS